MSGVAFERGIQKRTAAKIGQDVGRDNPSFRHTSLRYRGTTREVRSIRHMRER